MGKAGTGNLLFLVLVGVVVISCCALPSIVAAYSKAQQDVNVTAVLVNVYKQLPSRPDPLTKCAYCHRVVGVYRDTCIKCHAWNYTGILAAFNKPEKVHELHTSLAYGTVLSLCGPATNCTICHNPYMVGDLHSFNHPDVEDAAKVGVELRDCSACHAIGYGSNACYACHKYGMPHIPGEKDCTLCHGGLPNPTKPRKPPHITMPKGSKHYKILKVVPGLRSVCDACHDRELGYTQLLLVRSGIAVGYEQAVKLCGQSGCHARYHCGVLACHDPHKPFIARPAGFVDAASSPPLLGGLVSAVVVACIASYMLMRRRLTSRPSS